MSEQHSEPEHRVTPLELFFDLDGRSSPVPIRARPGKLHKGTRAMGVRIGEGARDVDAGLELIHSSLARARKQ